MRRSLLKDNAPLFESLVRVLDPLLVAAAGLAAYRIYLESWDLPERYILGLVGMTVCCALLFPFLELYRPQRGTSMFDEVRLLGRAWLLMAAAWFAFLFLTKSGIEFSRVWSTYWFLFGFASQFVFRIAIRLVLRRLRRHGYNLRHIVIVGAGALGREIVTRLGQAAWSGLVVRALYDDDPALIGTRIDGVPVLGPAHQVLRDLEEDSVDQVWLALPLRAEFRIREILAGLQQHAVQVRFVPDIFNFTLLRHTFSEIAGLPVVNLTDSPLKGGNLVVKSIEDMALSALILVVASPLLLLIAALVKLSSPGPVFYVQERITWNGERFRMLKFRTMPVGAEAGAVPVWARPGETRATPCGRHPAPVQSGRIAAVHQCAARGDVHRRAEARAAGVRRTLQAGDPRLHAKAPGQGRHHRVGSGERPSRQHAAAGAHQVRPLLHRKLVAVVRPAHHRAHAAARAAQPQCLLTQHDEGEWPYRPPRHTMSSDRRQYAEARQDQAGFAHRRLHVAGERQARLPRRPELQDDGFHRRRKVRRGMLAEDLQARRVRDFRAPGVLP